MSDGPRGETEPDIPEEPPGPPAGGEAAIPDRPLGEPGGEREDGPELPGIPDEEPPTAG